MNANAGREGLPLAPDAPDGAALYVFAWGNNAKRATLKGRTCQIVSRLRMNSAVIRFTDTGQIEVVSRNAIRKSAASPLPGQGAARSGPL